MPASHPLNATDVVGAIVPTDHSGGSLGGTQVNRLCCTVLCCAVLCCAVLCVCCAVLCVTRVLCCDTCGSPAAFHVYSRHLQPPSAEPSRVRINTPSSLSLGGTLTQSNWVGPFCHQGETYTIMGSNKCIYIQCVARLIFTLKNEHIHRVYR